MDISICVDFVLAHYHLPVTLMSALLIKGTSVRLLGSECLQQEQSSVRLDYLLFLRLQAVLSSKPEASLSASCRSL